MTCPHCQGHGFVQEIVHGELPEYLELFGHRFRVAGTLVGRRCPRCHGTRQVAPIEARREDRCPNE